LPSNPNSLDIVLVQKRETTAKGGDDADNRHYPRSIVPIEDGVAAAALFLHEQGGFEDKTIAIWPDGNFMVFRDAVWTGGLKLGDLLKVLASVDDSAPDYLIDAITVAGGGLDKTLTGTPDTDRTVRLSLSTTSPGPHLISIDPGTLYRAGSSGEVNMDGYHASEFTKNVTAYGSHSRYWFRSPTSKVDMKIKFALKSAAASSNSVRIVARVKSQPTYGSTGVAWQSTDANDVDVSSGAAKTIYEASLTLTPATFTAGDAVAFEIGRDGSHANDTFNKSIRLIAIVAEVV
jgi:hypothetical protein